MKLFPAGQLGAGYIKAVRAPLSHIPMLAVGGVTPENIPEFLDAGVCGFGIGSPLLPKAVIEADGGDASRIAIISSAYHLYRAKRMASALGMDAIGVAGSDGYPIYMFGMYLREAAAAAKLWIFGA